MPHKAACVLGAAATSPPVTPEGGRMDAGASLMARPALKPALRRVWRDASTLQIGLDPTHALIVGDIDDGLARWLEQLDGSKEAGEGPEGAC